MTPSAISSALHSAWEFISGERCLCRKIEPSIRHEPGTKTSPSCSVIIHDSTGGKPSSLCGVNASPLKPAESTLRPRPPSVPPLASAGSLSLLSVTHSFLRSLGINIVSYYPLCKGDSPKQACCVTSGRARRDAFHCGEMSYLENVD